MLWWVWDAPDVPGTLTGPYQGAYSAMGANGQFITVIPAMNLVVAHKVDFDADGNRRVSPDEYQAILQLLLNASL